MVFSKFPFIRQFDSADCALACIRMLCKFYNIPNCFDRNEYFYYTSNDGVALDAVLEIAKRNHFTTECGKIGINELIENISEPCILYWNRNHYVILYKVVRGKKTQFKIADPSKGKLIISIDEFKKAWGIEEVQNEIFGVAILLRPDKSAITIEENGTDSGKHSAISILSFIKKDKRTFFLIILGTFLGCLIQLAFPFMTQAIVDKGIYNQNIEMVIAILGGQFLLITGNLINDYFRKWMSLKFGYKFSLNLFADLINKLLKLPMRFFDSKHIGDFLQRFQDHDKIERFITNHIVNFTFSFISLIVLSIVLMTFSYSMFIVFIIGSILYIIWTLLFVNKKKIVNQKIFYLKSINQSRYHELIKGISEIKIQNYKDSNLKQIADLQNKLYENNIINLKIERKIESGNIFINELKNLIITFISAYLVIHGELTLGAMLSVQYIIGQLNVPINQLIVFINNYPEAVLSLQRINDILIKNDEPPGVDNICNSQDIMLDNLSFKYLITGDNVIQNISAIIPAGKTTAIVGASGSGKTTLIKILLKLYNPTCGNILYGTTNLIDVKTDVWHEACGAVLQDGYIFSDTIAKNIIMDRELDTDKLLQAIKIANIESFINNLPFKLDTKIGDEGINLSQGQKQRILIARTIYKDPTIIFFDEATNSLDTKNERIIIENLSSYLINKTAIIVAHRLSTVRNADLILVMDKGKIVEKGNHDSLILKRGYYYDLIKNQLELGI